MICARKRHPKSVRAKILTTVSEISRNALLALPTQKKPSYQSARRTCGTFSLLLLRFRIDDFLEALPSAPVHAVGCGLARLPYRVTFEILPISNKIVGDIFLVDLYA